MGAPRPRLGAGPRPPSGSVAVPRAFARYGTRTKPGSAPSLRGAEPQADGRVHAGPGARSRGLCNPRRPALAARGTPSRPSSRAGEDATPQGRRAGQAAPRDREVAAREGSRPQARREQLPRAPERRGRVPPHGCHATCSPFAAGRLPRKRARCTSALERRRHGSATVTATRGGHGAGRRRPRTTPALSQAGLSAPLPGRARTTRRRRENCSTWNFMAHLVSPSKRARCSYTIPTTSRTRHRTDRGEAPNAQAPHRAAGGCAVRRAARRARSTRPSEVPRREASRGGEFRARAAGRTPRHRNGHSARPEDQRRAGLGA